MLNLMRNEYQKIFTKKGTYVMLALILIIAAGFQILLNKITNQSSVWIPSRQDIESELSWYREVAANAADDDLASYNLDIALYQAMLDLEVYDADYWGQKQSWKGSALNTAYYRYYTVIHNTYDNYSDQEKADAQVAFDAIIDSIRNNDYKKYYQTVVDNSFKDDYEYLLYSTLLELDVAPDADDWRTDVVADFIEAKIKLDNYKDIDEDDYDDAYYNAKETYEIINYRLANNIRYCVTDNTADNEYDILTGGQSIYTFDSTYWSNVYSGSSMITLATIMAIVIAGGIIASEFSQGTIKFLLINPVKRSKIFFSKYLTLLTLTTLLCTGVLCINMLTNLFSGADGIGAVYLTYSAGKVVSASAFGLVIVPYLFSLVEAVVIVTLAFMISSIMRSSAVSIGISVGVLLIGNTATTILAALGLDWGRYLIFANTDLYSILHQQSMFPHHSMTFAVINIIAYMTVFLLTAYDGFTRKEV